MNGPVNEEIGVSLHSLIRHPHGLTGICFLVLAMASLGVQGQSTYEWTHTGTGAYDAPGNWDPNGVPGSLDTALFGNDLAGDKPTVQWHSGDTSNDTLRVEAGETTFESVGDVYTHQVNHLNISGGDLTLASLEITTLDDLSIDSGSTLKVQTDGSVTHLGSLDVTVGDTAVGKLRIDFGGSVSSASGSIGEQAGSSGGVIVFGTGSTWNNANLLTVGSAGNGSLSIYNGGSVLNTDGYLGDQTGSAGAAIVTGAGSRWINSNDLIVGHYGNGTLNIDNGGTVYANDGFVGGPLRDQTGATGVATVTGAGSTWTNRCCLFVGLTANGTLNIENGGSVFSNSTRIGNRSEPTTATVTVTGAGSRLVNTGGLTVEGSANTTLTIEAGGLVSSNDGRVGYDPGTVGELTIIGSSSTWINTGFLYVGTYGNGTMNIEDGGSVFSSGGWVSSGSTVSVTGTGSTWTSSGDLTVAHFGQGTLDITDGGSVFNYDGYIGDETGATGEVTVTGPGSTWTCSRFLYLGDYGSHGTLNIEDGGLVYNADSCYVGAGSGSGGARASGTVTVTGQGSTWINGHNLYLGGTASDGTLDINHGGAVFSENCYIDGVATVTGAGSTWTNDRYLEVGSDGNGELNIEDGATVSSKYGYIGDRGASTGIVTVTGANSRWINLGETNYDGKLIVGNAGDGTLYINNGGLVSSNICNIGEDLGSLGAVTVAGAGSVWNNSGDLHVGGRDLNAGGSGDLSVLDSGGVEVGGKLKVWGGGTVTLDGGTVVADTIDHTEGGTFDFLSGTLQVNTFNGPLVNQGGMLAPGSSPGVTHVNGDYDQRAGTVQIELDGTGSEQFDRVVATGAAMLAGTLDLVPGFTPSLGDEFAVVDADALGGNFDAVTVDGMPGISLGVVGGFDASLAVFYDDAAVLDGITNSVVTVRVTLIGDADGDDTVGLLDLDALGVNFGQSGKTWSHADFDGDGTVGLLDLDQLGVHFGNTYTPAAPATAPEPAAVFLLGIGGLALVGRGRSDR